MLFNTFQRRLMTRVYAAFVGTGVVYGTFIAPQASAQIIPAPKAPAKEYFSRYASPGQCVMGVVRMDDYYWRDKRKDTARYDLEHRQYPPIVRDSLRLCAAKFSIDKLTADDLAAMLDLVLAIGDDEMIRKTVTRIDETFPSLPLKRRVYLTYYVGTLFLRSKPVDFAQALRYGRLLGEMGKSAAFERLQLNNKISSLASEVGKFDLADSILYIAKAAIKDMERVERVNMVDSVATAYLMHLMVTQYRLGAQAALAGLDSAAAVVTPLTESGTPYDAAVKDNILGMFSFQRQLYESVGETAKPLRADRWYNVQGDSLFPKPGRVTYIVVIPSWGLGFESAAVLKRLYAKYASRGLEMVYATQTAGYFRFKVEPDPAEEMDQYKKWYVDLMKMEFPIVAEEAQFSRLPDGRRMNDPGVNSRNYNFGTVGALIGKNGKVRFVRGPDMRSETVLSIKIEQALTAAE